MFNVLSVVVLFTALAAPTAQAAQTVTLQPGLLDGAMGLVSWEFRLIQRGRQGHLDVSPGLAGIGMPELSWPLPRGYMGARIERLDSDSVSVTAGRDRLQLRIDFKEGSLGNALATYRIRNAVLEADLVPQKSPDGTVTFGVFGAKFNATVENTGGAISELYLEKARQDFFRLAGSVARSQLGRYFEQPRTQEAIRGLMLWWARAHAAPAAREIDARSIRIVDGALSFDAVE